MSPTQPILIEILARIQLRRMVKQQLASIKTDAVDQNGLGVVNPMTDESLVEVNNNETLPEKADDELR